MIPLNVCDRTRLLTLVVAAAALFVARGVAATDVDAALSATAVADAPGKGAAQSAAAPAGQPDGGKDAKAGSKADVTGDAALGRRKDAASAGKKDLKKDSSLAPQPDPGDVLARLLPPRSDSAYDWYAPLEPLHRCGEPRLLPTCVPPPPCHPAQPPQPFDLVGLAGAPTCGPIYRGPCAPRTGSHDNGPHPRLHRVHDRLFDWFYAPRTPILP